MDKNVSKYGHCNNVSVTCDGAQNRLSSEQLSRNGEKVGHR